MKLTHALRTFLLGSTLLAAISTLHAADGTWNVDANGLWSDTGNWTPGIADGSGFTANFTNNITADRTVSLDGDRTLTNLVFGDSNTATEGSWILNNNGSAGNNLILAGTTPGITVNALGTGKTATISAIIQGTEGLVKSGDGTLILSGANTFSGDRAVTGGTLSGTVAGAFGAQGNAANITISSGATLSYGTDNMFGGHDSTASPSLIVNGGTVTNSGSFVNSMRNITLNGGTLTATGGNGSWRSWIINGTVTSTGTSTISGSSGILLASGTPTNTNFDVQSGTLTVSAFLENGRQSASPYYPRATSLTKQGDGTLTLSGTNTYTGDLTVDGGTVIGTIAGAFGSFASTRTINVNSGGILDYGASNMGGGHNATNANLVITGGTVTNRNTDTFNSLNNVTLNGGTLTSTVGISTGEVWGAWHINGTVTSTGTSWIEGASINGRHIRLNANADNTDFDVQSGTLTVSAPIRNGRNSANTGERTSTLTKVGTGTMILSGVNAYTGITTVSAGKLTVSSTGNINTTSGVTIGTASTAATSEFNFNSSTALTKTVSFAAGSTGGTLSGTGTISQAVSITTGNTLAIGNSVGQMNFGSTLGLGGNTVMEIDGTLGAGLAGGHDFANVTGALTYGGALTLDLGATFGTGTYSWNLFDFAGADLGTFSTITLADQYSGNLLDGDFNGIWDLTSGSNTWQFTESTGVLGLTVIPEPRAALLGGLGLLALLRRRRA